MLKPLLEQFPAQINRENMSRNRDSSADNREFHLQKPGVDFGAHKRSGLQSDGGFHLTLRHGRRRQEIQERTERSDDADIKAGFSRLEKT